MDKYLHQNGRTLGNAAQEVLMAELCGTLPQRNHAGLDADSLQLGTVELVGTPRQLLEVDVWRDSHLP